MTARSSFSRRALLVAGAGTALTLGLAPLAGRAGATDLTGVTLRAATYKAGDKLLLETSGLLNELPYKLEFAEFGSGNLIVEAINGGSIDIGSMSEIPPVFAAASGARIKVVAIARDDVNWQVVLVPKDSPIRSVADLKGKRVGYVRATTTHYYLAGMLRKVGLTFSDITPVALTPADGQAAFDRGALDAWAIYGYNVVFSVNAGARVLITSNGYLSGNYAYSARAGALDDSRLTAAIGDYLDRLRRAYAWQGDNIDRWAEVHSTALGVTKDVDLQILRTSSQRRAIVPVTDEAVASSQAVADTFAELGVIPARIEVAPLFDRRFNDLLSKAA
jgi:sulfonate transport system substrate-binding protein